MKYFVFRYWDAKGSGMRYIFAESEADARRRLKQFINQHHPFRHFLIRLERIMPA